MYDDAGAVVSDVVLKDRIHMSQEGMFVVVLTVQRGTGHYNGGHHRSRLHLLA